MSDFNINGPRNKRRFIIYVVSIQLAFLGLIGLRLVGLKIPILDELICFIYVCFIPGAVIFKLFRLTGINYIHEIIYSLGLSSSVTTILALLINFMFNLVGCHSPISLIPMVIAISSLTLVLIIIYTFQKANAESIITTSIINLVFVRAYLIISLILILSLLGTSLVNFYKINLVLMLMIILIAAFVMSVGLRQAFPDEIYLLALWAISLSIIWHISLITPYTGVHDEEYYIASLIIDQHYWDWTYRNAANSVLSIVFLQPLISIITGVNLVWIQKLVIPIYLSFISPIVFCISRRYLNNINSFFAAFLVSIIIFKIYIITKQSVGMFYFALLLLVLFEFDMNKISKSIMILLFSFMVIVSHYGLAFIIMFSLIFYISAIYLLSIFKTSYKSYLFANYARGLVPISNYFILFFCTFTIAWFYYVSGSYGLDTLLGLVKAISDTIFMDFLSPKSSRGAYMLSTSYSGLNLILKYLFMSIPVLASIGVLRELHNFNKNKYNYSFIFYSLFYFALLLASVAIPYLASMSPDRLFYIAIIVMSPFCISGFWVISDITSIYNSRYANATVILISLYLIVIFLLNTQFLHIVLSDRPTTISLAQDYIVKSGSLEDRTIFYSNYPMPYDMETLKWLSTHMDVNSKLYFTGGYSHVSAFYINLLRIPEEDFINFNANTSFIAGSYILLTFVNLVENIGYGVRDDVYLFSYFDLNETICSLYRNYIKIYSNGDSQAIFVQH